MRIEELKYKIQSIDSKIPNINYGGCGTFSYHLHKRLKDKYGVDSEIYYLEGSRARIDYDIKFSHIVIKIGDYFIDNKGLYDVNTFPGYGNNKLSPEKLEEMIGIKDLWNDKFDVTVTDSNFMPQKMSDKLIKLIYQI